ncbi:MAG: transporter substrate-binding domain-containing protein [Rhizobium sp.]
MFKRLKSRIVATIVGAIALSSALAAAPVSANASTLDDILKRGELRVGISGDFAPYSTVDANNNWSGIDPDIAKLIADALGVKLAIVQTEGPNRLLYLLSGKVDIVISVLGITLDRAKQIAFSKPYSVIEVGIFAPKDKKIASVEDLVGQRIAVQRDASHAQLVNKIAPQGAKVLTFDNEVGQILAVANDQADALAGGPDLIQKVNKAKPGADTELKLVLHRQYNAVGIRRDDIDLKRFIDKVITYNTVSTDVLPKLQTKYFGKPLTDLPSF